MILKKTPDKFSNRVEIKTAWRPRHTDDGYWIWLDEYYAKQSYWGFPFGWQTYEKYYYKENLK
jgi:hypothetical protein